MTDRIEYARRLRQFAKDNRERGWKRIADDLDAAADLIERMQEVLEGVEWHQPTSNSNPSCPSCGAMQHWGHRDDCELAALVKGEGNG